MGNRHKVIQKLTKPQQEKLLVDIQTGATNFHKASREIGIADISIKRWFMSIPEDEKLRLVAQHLERARLAETERRRRSSRTWATMW